MHELELFATCPESAEDDTDSYFRAVVDAARMSEETGHAGFLIGAGYHLPDPWLVAQVVLQHTEHIRPMITVQPGNEPPWAVANRVTSLARLHQRGVHLHLTAGGLCEHGTSPSDPLNREARYDRLVEFGTIVRQLLTDSEATVYEGSFYQLSHPSLAANIPIDLHPEFFMAASSRTGKRATLTLHATSIELPTIGSPRPTDEPADASTMRVGVVARDTEAGAWDVAHRRFPTHGATRVHRRLAATLSDSAWLRQLAELGHDEGNQTLWMTPFESGHSWCPYLVGDYRAVARHLRGFMEAGCRRFLLDVIPSRDDLAHTHIAFRKAWARLDSPLTITG